jgi:hypothetical protein
MLAESVLQSLRGGNGAEQPKPPRDPALREAIREAWDASKRDDFEAYEEALDNIIKIKLAVSDR